MKETIDTWVNTQTGTNCPPPGVTSAAYGDASVYWTIAPGAKVGVWQKLSSRAGGESISSDQY